MKKVLPYIYAALLAGVMVALAVLLSFVIPLGTYLLPLELSFFAVTLLCVIFSLVFYFSRRKKLEQHLRQMIDDIEKKKQMIEKEGKKAYQKVIRNYYFLMAYAVFHVLFSFVKVTLLCALLRDASSHASEWSTFIFLIEIFIFFDFFYILFINRKTPKFPFEVAQKDAPNLYQTVKDVQNELQNHDSIHLIPVDDGNIGVEMFEKNLREKDLMIYLDIALLNLLDKKDLKAILYHEIGHVIHEDTKNSSKMALRNERISELVSTHLGLDAAMTLLLLGFANPWQEQFQLVQHFTSIEREKNADSVLLSVGKQQEFINATAKCHAYAYFLEIPSFYHIFDDKMEHQETHITQSTLKAFSLEWESRSELYTLFLRNSLVERFPTHPNLKQRMEQLQVKDFFLDFTPEQDELYRAEVEKITETYNQKWYESVKDQIQVLKNNHDESMLFLQEYEKKESPTLQEKRRAAEIYQENFQLETAEKLYLEILKENPEEQTSLYQLALIYVYLNDERCIDYFEKIMERYPDLVEDTMMQLGNYYMRNGLEEKRLELREKQPEIMQNFIELKKKESSVKNMQFLPTSIDENLKNSLVEIAQKNPNIQKMTALEVVLKGQENHHIFIGVFFKIPHKKQQEELKKTLQDLQLELNHQVGSVSEYELVFSVASATAAQDPLINQIKNNKNNCVLYKK